uniref:Mitogen-activated protein kinase kinase kinase 7 interacting protein 1 n=2 Tax=Apis cerana TaxID=7461 RepID=V9IGP9_APICE
MPENDYSSTGITEENSDLSTTETSSTSDIYPDAKSTNKNTRIKSYVNFSEYYENVEKRRREGTLPEGINF